MFKKIFYGMAIACALLFTQTSNAAAIETNQTFQIAVVELDTEFRDRINLPYLRDKDNNPLTNKSGNC